jgi:predicted dienelactone hydrolase
MRPAFALMALFTLAFACAPPPRAQARNPAPAGAASPRRFAVSSTVIEATDRQRPEPFTAEPLDHRTLVIRAFYPAPGPGGAFPVVIYSPGRNAPTSAQLRLLQELASRGHVVVAVSGRLPPDLVDSTLAPSRRAQLVALMSADQRFALAAIEALAGPGSPHPLAGRLDTRRVGTFGSGLGAGAAARTCDEDPWFRACADGAADPAALLAFFARRLGGAQRDLGSGGNSTASRWLRTGPTTVNRYSSGFLGATGSAQKPKS